MFNIESVIDNLNLNIFCMLFKIFSMQVIGSKNLFSIENVIEFIEGFVFFLI